MENVVVWLNDKPRSARTGALAAIVLVPLALLAATAIAFSPAAPFVGALAGGALFVAVYGYWRTMLSAEEQDATDLKQRYPLKQRRGLIGAALAVWVITLLLTNPYLPGPVLGTLNVFVLISLYWLWRATPTEAAEALAAWEAAEAAKDAGTDDNLDADQRP